MLVILVGERSPFFFNSKSTHNTLHSSPRCIMRKCSGVRKSCADLLKELAHFKIVQKRIERNNVYIVRASDWNRAAGGVYRSPVL